MPQRLHIVGRKKHGKTTLVVELVPALAARGLRVGTIKHSRHFHDLDQPGTDSYCHRQAGGAPAAIVTDGLAGVFFPHDGRDDYWERLAPLYADCDLVLVESDLAADAPKLEVWRAAAGTPSLAGERPDITAVVTDDPLEVAVPVLPRRDLRPLVDFILHQLMEAGR